MNFPIQIPANADLNNYTTPGMYWVPTDARAATISNSPTTHAFALFVEKGANADPIQTLKTWMDADNKYKATIYIRSGYPNWGLGWQKIGTATPPHEYTLQLADGWTQNTPCKYFKTQENMVVVILDAARTDPITGSVSLATLPEGYRPPYAIRCIATTDAAGANATNVLIDKDGGMRINLRSTEDIYCVTQVVFVASG